MKNFTSRAAKLGVGLLAAGITLNVGATKAHAFDFDHGNSPIEIVIPTVVPTIFASVSGPSDASLILRFTSEFTAAWFDAIAPYEPTQKGVYSHFPRRPASEGLTDRNRNIAILYSSYRVMNSLFPKQNATWQSMLSGVGLDPNDNSTDPTTAVGIGNVAGANLVAFREHDGMNQLGTEGGHKYNLQPYADYLGYEPVNTAYDLIDPSRWQPKMTSIATGIFRIQQHVTPQWAVTSPYFLKNVDSHVTPGPTASMLSADDCDDDHHGHGHYKKKGNKFAAYKAQVDQVLATSANLTDTQKMLAELFNDKIQSLGFADVFINFTRGFTLSQFVQYDYLENIAAFDGGIVVWKEKLHWDAVRPFSAIKFVYGDSPVTAWGGPGKGRVTDLPASEWKEYLGLPDHSEYPSGSTCFCTAHAQASRRFLGSDAFGWTETRLAGSSVIEPGVTPATDITFSFPTWTDFETQCGLSRNYGGVHFLASIQDAHDLCKPIGDEAYEWVKAHIDGTSP